VQELATWADSLTKGYPGYERFTLADFWDQNEESRPKVLTYVKKGKKLLAEAHLLKTRKLLWVEVNGVLLLNFY
jgi:hypothetical protein